MPTATRVGKKWRGRANVDGQQISAGNHKTKAEALRAALDIEQRRAAGTSDKKLRHVFDRYAAEVSPTKRSGGAWEVKRLAFYVRDPIADKRLDQLTPEDFNDLRDRRLKVVSGSTITRDLTLISHALKVAVREWRLLRENPLTVVRRPRSNAPRQRRVHPGEIEALRIASGYRPGQPAVTATQRVVAAFEFACETAMRGAEICELQRSDLQARHLHIRESKNGEARDVPLSPRALQILGELGPRLFDLTVRQKDALFRKLRRRAGIAGLNFHDSRREGTCMLAQKFGNVLDLARVTGHKDLQMLRDVYYVPTADELADRLAG